MRKVGIVTIASVEAASRSPVFNRLFPEPRVQLRFESAPHRLARHRPCRNSAMTGALSALARTSDACEGAKANECMGARTWHGVARA